jgi:hypothetical protein
MKVGVNLLLAVVLGGLFTLMSPIFYTLFAEAVTFERTANIHWGWFDWLTVAAWLPRLFIGFVAGLCMAILAYGDRPHSWSLALGVLMMIVAYVITRAHWYGEPTVMQQVFSRVWPIMYPLGAWLGAVVAVALKRKLQRRQRSGEAT